MGKRGGHLETASANIECMTSYCFEGHDIDKLEALLDNSRNEDHTPYLNSTFVILELCAYSNKMILT